jgi:urease gamma subunit
MTAMLNQNQNPARLERVASPSSFHIEAGDLTRFIRITGVGFWTPAEIDTHFDELGDLIARMRQVRTDVRILVDLRESGVQSPETIARISARITDAYRDGDRIAMVLSSSLAKMQMKRAIQNLQHEMFVSPKAAEQWLMAYN